MTKISHAVQCRSFHFFLFRNYITWSIGLPFFGKIHETPVSFVGDN